MKAGRAGESPAESGRGPATDWRAPAAAGPVRARLRPPGSKSVTNRALVLAALAGGPTVITNPLRARDTLLMAAALRALGATIEDASAGAGGEHADDRGPGAWRGCGGRRQRGHGAALRPARGGAGARRRGVPRRRARGGAPGGPAAGGAPRARRGDPRPGPRRSAVRRPRPWRNRRRHRHP